MPHICQRSDNTIMHLNLNRNKILSHIWNMPHICQSSDNTIMHLDLNRTNTNNLTWTVITYFNRTTINRIIRDEPISINAYMKRWSGIKNPFITTICTSSKSNKNLITIRTTIGSNRSITFFIGFTFRSVCASFLLFVFQFNTLRYEMSVLLAILVNLSSLSLEFERSFKLLSL